MKAKIIRDLTWDAIVLLILTERRIVCVEVGVCGVFEEDGSI